MMKRCILPGRGSSLVYGGIKKFLLEKVESAAGKTGFRICQLGDERDKTVLLEGGKKRGGTFTKA